MCSHFLKSASVASICALIGGNLPLLAAEADTSGSGGTVRSEPQQNVPGPNNVPSTVEPATDKPTDTPESQIRNMFGVRKSLEETGFTFELTFIADYSKNFSGGLTRGDAFRHLFDARFNFDTQPLLNLDGGLFSIDFQNQAGRNGSDVVGDAQGFDNIDADGRTQVSELWYQQTLLDKKLRIKIGKVDANSEFAAPQAGSEFIQSAFGYSPTITTMPTYPDPALSINLFADPVEWFSIGYGIYDTGDGEPTGNHPPTTAFESPTDYFHIIEGTLKWKLAGDTLPGRFVAGAFYNNSAFERFDGSTQSGTSGYYLLAEQKLYHYKPGDKDDQRGVYAFAQYGFADQQVSEFREHLGAGITWVGPYESENPDTLGVGVSMVFFTDAAGASFSEDSETSIEAFYNLQLTPYLSIKPDLQYIVNPGGDAAVDDALVGTLRVTLLF